MKPGASPFANPLFGRALVLAAVVMAADQACKLYLLTAVMNPPRVIDVLPFFDLVLYWNRGVSFSLFTHEAAIMPYVLSGVALLVVGFLLLVLRRAEDRLTALSIGLIVGGALGNVIDRLLYGAVADFFYFNYGRWWFPAFNIADTAITLGAIGFLWTSLFPRRRSG
jgi:signal peptidase II